MSFIRQADQGVSTEFTSPTGIALPLFYGQDNFAECIPVYTFTRKDVTNAMLPGSATTTGDVIGNGGLEEGTSESRDYLLVSVCVGSYRGCFEFFKSVLAFGG